MSNLTSASGEASISSGNRGVANTLTASAAAAAAANNSSNTCTKQPSMKRKRSLPGTPDPDAEVIALSPKTLMTTNRFVCEICNKGFQRDQNLQLHRRGHNLPWKLKQRTSKEIRKRVYICPEQSCVHHDPARALGDLTGVKKHFCRKHGEKKWKCDKCSKRYAVHSDWKAHSKTCGTREYRCDCGTLFSRRDSFITHRAFCDALAEESARVSAGITGGGGQLPGAHTNNPLAVGQAGGPMSVISASPNMGRGPLLDSSQFSFALRPPCRMGIPDQSGSSLRSWDQDFSDATVATSRPRLSLWLGQGPGKYSGSTDQVTGNSGGPMLDSHAFFTQSPKGMLGLSDYDDSHEPKALAGLLPMSSSNPATLYSNLLGSEVAHLPVMNASSNLQQNGISSPTDYGVTNWTDRSGSAAAAARLSLSTSAGLTTSSASGNNHIMNDSGGLSTGLYNHNNSQQHTYISQMSATALLQKAAQMGATASNSALFGAFGVSDSSTVGLGLSWQGSGAQNQQRMAGMIMSHGLDHNNSHHHTFNMKGAMDNITSQAMPNSQSSQVPQGLQDLMNSLSGAGAGSGYFGGSGVLNNVMPPTFGGNIGGDSGSDFGGMMNIPRNSSAHDINQHIPVNNDIGNVSDLQSQQQMMHGNRTASPNVLPGMGNHELQRALDVDGGDRLTRDFLGVGGATSMGGLGRTLSQRDIENIASLGSGIELVSYSNQRENSQSIGAANGLSPTKSWDAS